MEENIDLVIRMRRIQIKYYFSILILAKKTIGTRLILYDYNTRKLSIFKEFNEDYIDFTVSFASDKLYCVSLKEIHLYEIDLERKVLTSKKV